MPGRHLLILACLTSTSVACVDDRITPVVEVDDEPDAGADADSEVNKVGISRVVPKGGSVELWFDCVSPTCDTQFHQAFLPIVRGSDAKFAEMYEGQVTPAFTLTIVYPDGRSEAWGDSYWEAGLGPSRGLGSGLESYEVPRGRYNVVLEDLADTFDELEPDWEWNLAMRDDIEAWRVDFEASWRESGDGW